MELAAQLKFPLDLLPPDSTLSRLTCIHMFESSPQSKCAVAYLITRHSESFALIVVYSVSTKRELRVLRNESEVTQMCTPGDDSLLICGTVHGSICLYDLKELEPQGDSTDGY